MTRQKVLQAIHFICHTAQGLPLGATRLNKILWFAEKDSFLRTLQPMLGLSFVKGPFGPMPPDAATACGDLAKAGAISCEIRQYGSYTYKEMRSLRAPDTPLLAEDEKESLRELTWEICTEHSARSISDLTHNAIYHLLSMGEAYPLELALVEHARGATEKEILTLAQEG